jgi:hypothetical protein
MEGTMTQTYYFLHIASGQFWQTDDPHCWLLDHRDDDLLAPARERLVLSTDDPERCLRVAVRRCDLALVCVVTYSHIVVRHWGEPAPDMRTVAKKFGWNRSGIGVTFESLKSGKVIVHQDAEDLLVFGERVWSGFSWGVYEAKHERRHVDEPGDEDTAPAFPTNFVWANRPNGLNWKVLKAAWNTERVECPNCDVPLILVAFEWQKGMLSFRSGKVVRHCFRCQRRFEVAEDRPHEWLASVLPAPLRPTHLRLWAKMPINWSVLSLGVGATCASR